jgi:hypothetical protein
MIRRKRDRHQLCERNLIVSLSNGRRIQIPLRTGERRELKVGGSLGSYIRHPGLPDDFLVLRVQGTRVSLFNPRRQKVDLGAIQIAGRKTAELTLPVELSLGDLKMRIAQSVRVFGRGLAKPRRVRQA